MPTNYARLTHDNPNPIARFAHRRRYALSLDFTTALAQTGTSLMDYGCGEGAFLELLAARRPDLQLIGFDPYQTHAGQSYRKVEEIASVEAGSVDVLTCFETLEHLSDQEIADYLDAADSVLRPEGVLVVSVPIMMGPMLTLKIANRMVLTRRRSEYTLKEYAESAFRGKAPVRPVEFRFTHKGFDFRTVPETVARRGYLPVRQTHSPFRPAAWWLNSQVFYAFARR